MKSIVYIPEHEAIKRERAYQILLVGLVVMLFFSIIMYIDSRHDYAEKSHEMVGILQDHNSLMNENQELRYILYEVTGDEHWIASIFMEE